MTYPLFTSPVGFDFDTMSRAEARQYFGYFMEQIPVRIAILEQRVRQTPGFKSWAADGSDMSVAGLGVWLAETASPREMTEEDYEALRESNHGPLSKVMHEIYPVDLTAETYSYCMDAGMYFGEVLRQRHSDDISWRIGPTKPKRGLTYNQPMIAANDDDVLALDASGSIARQVLTFVQLGRRFDLLEWLKEIESRVEAARRDKSRRQGRGP